MNPAALTLADVQGQFDARGIGIDEVGIDRLAYPITFRGITGAGQPSVAEAELVASLDADVRGTHMSRFVEVLHVHRDDVAPETSLAIARELRRRLGARAATVQMRFPLFLERAAPVSGASALLRYDCHLGAQSAEDEDERSSVGVRVAVTSLCPCSKDISDYGAHSQRGYVELRVEHAPGRATIWPEQLVEIVSAAGSAPVYPLLKRVDEREVTMRAYDNPAFVEDLARDVAVALRRDARIHAFEIDVANEESIHDHRAVARLRWRRTSA